MHHRLYRSRRSGFSRAVTSRSSSSKINRVRPLALVTGVAFGLFALPGASSSLTLPLSQPHQQELTHYDTHTSQLAASNARLPPPPVFSKRKPSSSSSSNSPFDFDSQDWENEGYLSENDVPSIVRYEELQRTGKTSALQTHPPPRQPAEASRSAENPRDLLLLNGRHRDGQLLTQQEKPVSILRNNRRQPTGKISALQAHQPPRQPAEASPSAENPRDLLLFNGRRRRSAIFPRRRRFNRYTPSLPPIPEDAPLNIGLTQARRNAIVPGNYPVTPPLLRRRPAVRHLVLPSVPKLKNAVDPSEIPQPSNRLTRNEKRLFRRFAPYIRRTSTPSTEGDPESESQASARPNHPPPMTRVGNYFKNLVHKASKTISAGRALLPTRLRRFTPPEKQTDLDKTNNVE